MKWFFVPQSRWTASGDGFMGNVTDWKTKKYNNRFLFEGLGDVGDDERLYIVGHGALHGTSLQTRSADDLFQILKVEKLPATHRRFSLFSCYSGVRTVGQSQSFAEAFADAIKGHFRNAVIDGYRGAVNFNIGRGRKELIADYAVFNFEGDDDSTAHADSPVSAPIHAKRQYDQIRIVNGVVTLPSAGYRLEGTEEEIKNSFLSGTQTTYRPVRFARPQ
jgi:hypothetical protein